MAGVAAILILILTSLLPAAAIPCGALRPDNSTAAKLLGTWLYVAGAAQFPRHLLEMLLIDHGYLHVEPGASEQELPITQSVAVGDQCLTNNSTYMEITAGSTMLVKEAKSQQTVGTLMDLSSDDVLLIQYQLQRERMYLGLYLYARNLSISRAQREEFESQAKCLGLSEEGIVYAPWRRKRPPPLLPDVMSRFPAWLDADGVQEHCTSQLSSHPSPEARFGLGVQP